MNKLLFALCVLFAGIHMTAADKPKSKLVTPEKKVKDPHLTSPGKAADYSPLKVAKGRGERNYSARKHVQHPHLPGSAKKKLDY